jgi:PST family polysaccharide transporter
LVQVIQLAVTVVLARLLAPSDFGAVALVTTITGFAALLVELGLVSALVQRSLLDERILATAFWLNAALGVALAVPVVALTPLAIEVFDTPSLGYLMPVASLTFVLSLSIVQSALLRRALDFRRLALIGLINSVVNGVVAVIAAAFGAGALSLVLGSVAATAASTVQAWCYVPWRPKVRPDRTSLAELWRYSRGLVGFGSVNYWSRNADNLLIGGVLGTAPLGFYGRAYNLMLMPVSQLNAILGSILFATLSKLQPEPRRFSRAWLLGTKAAWAAGTPVGIGMAATAPALVDTLFGDGWSPMVPVLTLLALSVPPQCIGTTTGAVYQARAKNDLQFRLGALTSGITVIVILVALPFGIAAVAGALLIKAWSTLLITLLPALRLAGVGFGQLVRALAWTGFSAAVMGIAVWALGLRMQGVSSPATLAAQVGVGVAVYGGLFMVRERRFLKDLRGARR